MLRISATLASAARIVTPSGRLPMVPPPVPRLRRHPAAPRPQSHCRPTPEAVSRRAGIAIREAHTRLVRRAGAAGRPGRPVYDLVPDRAAGRVVPDEGGQSP